MKILFPTFILISSLFFSSCTRYVRAITLRANAAEMDSMSLLYANDSFSIQYDFYGAGADMKMRIFNKLDIPLVVNWAQSSYVIGSQSISYINTPGWRDDVNYDKSSQVATVPPHSFLQKAVFISLPVNFVTLPLQNHYKHKVMTPMANAGDSFSISESDYKISNTPFSFRNYLSLSYDPAFSKTIHIDQTFWVAEIRDMKADYFLGSYQDETGNTKFTQPFMRTNCFYLTYQPNQ